MKILVTGGTGFVMSHVVRRVLERDPDARALVLDTAPPDAGVAAFFQPVATRIETLAGDAGAAATWAALDTHRDVSHIVHGAAVTSIVGGLPDCPDQAARAAHITRSLQTNLMGVAHALEFAASLPCLRRFVNVSSGSVYALRAPPGPLPEDGHVRPEGLYAASKYSAELTTRGFADQFGVSAVSVRLSGVYGPLDRTTPSRDVRCVPFRIAHGARAGKVLRVNSLQATGDFIHAGDVADAIAALLMAADLGYPVYNIAYGEAVSVGELLDITREHITDLDFEVAGDGRADIYLDPALNRGRYGAYDIRRLARDTGWRPRPMAAAMHDYLDWLADNPF